MSMDGAIDGAIDRARRDEMFAVLERMEGMFGNAQDAEQDAEELAEDAEQLAMLRAELNLLSWYRLNLHRQKIVHPELDGDGILEGALIEKIADLLERIDRLLPEPDTSTDEDEGDYEGLRL